MYDFALFNTTIAFDIHFYHFVFSIIYKKVREREKEYESRKRLYLREEKRTQYNFEKTYCHEHAKVNHALKRNKSEINHCIKKLKAKYTNETKQNRNATKHKS